jgi:23S rRNA (cytidine2498-2'-O)-methyltransferase
VSDSAALAPLGLDGFLAAEGYETELEHELGEVRARYGRLLLAPPRARDPAWAANVWRDPRIIPIRSIRDAARALRGLQRNWAGYSWALHRRAALIQDALPRVSARPLNFPEPPPRAPLGSFTLKDEHTLIAAPRCASPFPHGEVRFVEDREGPPSRAYLKLWEALTRAETCPGPGERCLDLGASPGGWTWVLSELGAEVIAVDRAPLAPELSARPNVEERIQSAFALDPAEFGRPAKTIDWLVSDIACYPRRLLELLARWDAAGALGRAVCTIKFQGPTDHAAAAAFLDTLGGTLVHLHHNKHELTWMRTRV